MKRDEGVDWHFDTNGINGLPRKKELRYNLVAWCCTQNRKCKDVLYICTLDKDKKAQTPKISVRKITGFRK